MLRSWPSSFFAIVQPSLTSPMSWDFGTFTLSKNVSQNADAPLINLIGRTSTPGLCISNSRKLIPPCLFEVSVRTRQNIQSA